MKFRGHMKPRFPVTSNKAAPYFPWLASSICHVYLQPSRRNLSRAQRKVVSGPHAQHPIFELKIEEGKWGVTQSPVAKRRPRAGWARMR